MNSQLQILAVPLQMPPKAFKKAYLFPNTSSLIPIIARRYDANFQPDDAYRASLPDMTETVGAVEGASGVGWPG